MTTQPKQEKIYQMNDSTCLDAKQEQEHMLIEICKDIKWKDGDDHTFLLPFEMQIPFVWSQWIWDSPT